MVERGNGMRVAVTGATGNVGIRVIRALHADPDIASIVGIARRETEWRMPKLEMAVADIVSDKLDRIFSDCDAVVHLAWLMQPSRDPLLTWRTNVVGSKRVFQAVAAAGVKSLVCASSVGAYSPRTTLAPVDEEWPTDGWPTAPYTREKAYVERVLDLFERANPDIRVSRMRTGFVFQPESASQQRRLFAGPLLPHMLVQPRFVPAVPAIPELRMQVVHAVDAAEAYRLAVTTAATGAFNVGTTPEVDASVLAEVLGAPQFPLSASVARAAVAAAWHARVSPTPPALFDAAIRLPIMDTSRARDQLGWSPQFDAMEVLKDFLGGMRQAGAFPTPPLRRRISSGRIGELATGVGSRQLSQRSRTSQQNSPCGLFWLATLVVAAASRQLRRFSSRRLGYIPVMARHEERAVSDIWGERRPFDQERRGRLGRITTSTRANPIPYSSHSTMVSPSLTLRIRPTRSLLIPGTRCRNNLD